jgi:hypothetical protein
LLGSARENCSRGKRAGFCLKTIQRPGFLDGDPRRKAEPNKYPLEIGNDKMSEQQNIETIQQMYEAFGRAEVASIVAKLTDDVKSVSHSIQLCLGAVTFQERPRFRGSSKQSSRWRSRRSNLRNGWREGYGPFDRGVRMPSSVDRQTCTHALGIYLEVP